MPDKQTIDVGSKAPTFSLKDQAGQTVKLTDVLAKGPVVLVFYPGDMTPGCTMQLCAIRDDWKDFQALGVTVLGINHADASSHGVFANAYHFPFPLLIDTKKIVSEEYQATRSFFRTTIIRRTVVGIGTDGRIFYYKRGMPKDGDILKSVQEAIRKA